MRILPRDIPVVRGIRRTRPVPRRDMSSPEPKPYKHFSKRSTAFSTKIGLRFGHLDMTPLAGC